jgi:hypothetical protein
MGRAKVAECVGERMHKSVCFLEELVYDRVDMFLQVVICPLSEG